jgi:hypothetical protein
LPLPSTKFDDSPTKEKKGLSLTSSSLVLPYASVPTLKEYMWKELTDILQMHSTVPLLGRDISSPAMKKFRCVVHCICTLLSANNMVIRAKIRSDWQHSIHLMDSSEPPACPGEAVTPDEFRRIALTVALAISNPRK